MNRRTFLTLTSRSAAAAWFSSPLFTTYEGQQNLASPTRANVRAFGAKGDGRTDDTVAFERVIHFLQPHGGTVIIPDGVYLIDPVRSVVLVDNLTLAFDSRAVLKAIPVEAGKSALILGDRVRNAAVVGGAMVGEQRNHAGTAGEWGMGIGLYGCSDIKIEQVSISECWGDGIYIGLSAGHESERITIKHCISSGNRRQAMSITGCIGATVFNCTFSATRGTLPECGIDIEPKGEAVVRDVEIAHCKAIGNAGYGITVSGANVSNVRLRDNMITSNALGGILIYSATDSIIERNVVEKNGGHGIEIMQGIRTAVATNTIRLNSQSASGRFDNVFVGKGAANTHLTDNTFLTEDGADPAGYDVRINSPDCVGTTGIGNKFRPRRAKGGGVADHGTGTLLNESA